VGRVGKTGKRKIFTTFVRVSLRSPLSLGKMGKMGKVISIPSPVFQFPREGGENGEIPRRTEQMLFPSFRHQTREGRETRESGETLHISAFPNFSIRPGKLGSRESGEKFELDFIYNLIRTRRGL